MPELPEVEVVRTGLEPLLQGRRIVSVTSSGSLLRYPLPDLASLCGNVVRKIDRRSKYLIFYFEHLAESFDSQVLIWHLGMTGQFYVLDSAVEAGKHEHVRFDFDDGSTLRYRDARRFGYAGLSPEVSWQKARWFAALGPEPLSHDFDVSYFYRRCQGRKVPIKSFVMDANVVVGVGNIYASESLFKAGIHPKRLAGNISKARVENLLIAIQETLRAAIVAGGSTISDFVRVDGEPGYFAHDFKVYGREGEPCCMCGDRIRRLIQSGRSTFYCANCQH